jgi:hypothetical protein
MNRKQLLIMLFVVATITCLGLADVAFSETKERGLVFHPWENAPVKIISVKSAKGPLKIDKRSALDEKWLKGLSVKIRNISNKNIISVQYVLTLHADGKSGQNPIGTELSYGEPGSQTVQVAPIPPKGELELTLNDSDLNSFDLMVKRRNRTMNDILTAQLNLQMVCFDDGTCWVAGTIVEAEKFFQLPNEDSSFLDRTNPEPQMAFCGVLGTSIRFPCCSCNGTTHFFTQYFLKQAQGGISYAICPFYKKCECPNSYIECEGHTLVSCTGSILACSSL